MAVRLTGRLFSHDLARSILPVTVSLRAPSGQELDTATITAEHDRTAVSLDLSGHHVWPQFVGGAPAQSLMSIRGTVHISIVHPSLNGLLLLTARGMGHTISTHTTDPRNIAFVAHLRRDIRHRGAYSGVMAGYYAGLNMVTHPPIPAAAYLRGITYAFPRS